MASEEALIKTGAPKVAPTPRVSAKLHPEVLAAQSHDILSVLLLFRFVNALCIRTFFQPDEYFQALEPAWRVAFGENSGAWLTWEWQHQLRSSLHPAFFGALYFAAEKLMSSLQFFPQFQALILVALPKVVQSVFAAYADFCTWKLAERIYGQGSNAAWSAFWVAVFNPWLWYCSTRTFSNSVETTLTVVALYHWPWEMLGDAKEAKEDVLSSHDSVKGLRISLVSAAVAVVLRPTNLLIWLAILTLALSRLTLDGSSPLGRRSLVVLVREIAVCGLSVLTVSLVSDRLYYGFWTFPPYRFLHFNLSQSLAVFYGHMPWHYYLSQGVPLLTTTFLPFSLLGLVKQASPSTSRSTLQANTLRTLTFTVLTTVGSLSLISHKEVRFIYPLLPILHILAAPFVSSFFTAEDPVDSRGDTSPAASGRWGTRPSQSTTTLRHKFFLAHILSINILLATYLSVFHQPAPISVVHFLRTEFERVHPDRLHLHRDGSSGDDADPLFALFLTPCHSTPWRSHLVYPRLRARALTCEPPLHTKPGSPEREAYLDEADRFYHRDDAAFVSGSGPSKGTWGVGFLDREMWPRRRAVDAAADGGEEGVSEERAGEVPRYLVGFEGIEPVLTAFFQGEAAPGRALGVNLTRRWEAFNGLFNEDWRRRGKLVVWDTGAGRGDSEGD
ncbi:hypothetical protein VTK73DRAFT_7721 [Phialemonium thermophilum]|uniref:Mannosyltransferase n=1 Tax=Phialemonium thermophilum TaxID=223376 RepID=A0ABR3WD65_9PEZI